jgi:hypothetical protein
MARRCKKQTQSGEDKMRTFLMVVGAALLLVLLPAHGEAQNVPSEINRYRAVSVTFSENAGKCNLADDSMLRAKLTSELANAGVQQSDASRLVVNYAVSANGQVRRR